MAGLFARFERAQEQRAKQAKQPETVTATSKQVRGESKELSE